MGASGQGVALVSGCPFPSSFCLMKANEGHSFYPFLVHVASSSRGTSALHTWVLLHLVSCTQYIDSRAVQYSLRCASYPMVPIVYHR